MSRSESELKSKRPLSWVRFYSRVFSDVVKLSWERTDFTAAALGLVIPLLIHFLPGKEAALLPLLWKLPVGVFIGVAAMRLVMAPYVLYRDQYLARETIENDLQKQIDVERAKLQQPDVALIWEWLADEKRTQDMLERTEKHILVHNRSNEYVYNVRISPISLGTGLAFDAITEIPANGQQLAVGRWDGRSTKTTNYIYFFGPTETEAKEKRLYVKKPHDRGLSSEWFKIPMAVTYEAHGFKWQSSFEFTYDPGGESYFEKVSGRRL